MKVMPNSAMMTVTAADSKYSRNMVFGGPTSSGATSTARSRPFGFTSPAVTPSDFSLVFFSVVIVDSLIANIVEAAKQGGQVKFRSDFNLKVTKAINTAS